MRDYYDEIMNGLIRDFDYGGNHNAIGDVDAYGAGPIVFEDNSRGFLFPGEEVRCKLPDRYYDYYEGRYNKDEY